MTPGARLSAAIEVLAEIAARRRPAAEVLKDWGLSHRFAGSGDRAAIAGLVYDALRRRASASWIMGGEAPRAILIGSLRLARGLDPATISDLCSGERHSPAALTDAEWQALRRATLDDAPDDVAADVPAWLVPSLRRSFGGRLVDEGRALARRAPLDLRVNTLRADRPTAAAELAHLAALPTTLSPVGLRVEVGPDGRPPAVAVDPAYLAGLIEIQDEGSQLASLLAGARPGEAVLDLCAGGGGKSLALAAVMAGMGRIVATDADPRRLAPIHERLRRAGVTNVEVRTPRGRTDPLDGEAGGFDLVLVDAPCSGTGTWRRNPDAKWRLRPNSLALRLAEQRAVLDRALHHLRPGGRLVYVTCSVLPEENDDALAALLERSSGLSILPPASVAAAAGLDPLVDLATVTRFGLQMTPLRTGTDGFYVGVVRRD